MQEPEYLYLELPLPELIELKEGVKEEKPKRGVYTYDIFGEDEES